MSSRPISVSSQVHCASGVKMDVAWDEMVRDNCDALLYAEALLRYMSNHKW
jgi:hypothetical protein